MNLKNMNNTVLLQEFERRLLDSVKNPESIPKAMRYWNAMEELGRRLGIPDEDIARMRRNG